MMPRWRSLRSSRCTVAGCTDQRSEHVLGQPQHDLDRRLGGPTVAVHEFAKDMGATGSAGSSVSHARGFPPGTPSAWETPPAVPAHCRLLINGSFAVLDRQQRRLHDRAQTQGFADLNSYLVARCQQDASLTQLAAELHTTIDVVRRLIDQAGIHRCSPKVRSARFRRRTTDRRLTERAAQLGFASLQAYLADRVTEQAWTLPQVASELGVHPDTVRDRLDRHGLRRIR
jgi:hypothetical protein